VTRHFSQFLFAPYGDGEGLRAVDAHAADEALSGADAALDASDPCGAVGAVAETTRSDARRHLTAVEWPITHRPFDDDEPEIVRGPFAAAGEDPAGDEDEATDAEAAEEAAAHAARAALLAEVYGWPHRAV
jgi:hypothetical protein